MRIGADLAKGERFSLRSKIVRGGIIMNALEGKVTLITGAKGGLGAFITEGF